MISLLLIVRTVVVVFVGFNPLLQFSKILYVRLSDVADDCVDYGLLFGCPSFHYLLMLYQNIFEPYEVVSAHTSVLLCWSEPRVYNTCIPYYLNKLWNSEGHQGVIDTCLVVQTKLLSHLLLGDWLIWHNHDPFRWLEHHIRLQYSCLKTYKLCNIKIMLNNNK